MKICIHFMFANLAIKLKTHDCWLYLNTPSTMICMCFCCDVWGVFTGGAAGADDLLPRWTAECSGRWRRRRWRGTEAATSDSEDTTQCWPVVTESLLAWTSANDQTSCFVGQSIILRIFDHFSLFLNCNGMVLRQRIGLNQCSSSTPGHHHHHWGSLLFVVKWWWMIDEAG